MKKVNDAMSQGDAQLRADVWWSLYDDAEDHDHEMIVGAQRIRHLLTPIPGRTSVEQILNIIPKELRDRWRDENNHRSLGPARDVMEGLDKLDGIEAESSRKRKRGKDTVEEVIRMLKRDWPDMKLEDSKDILPSLLAQVKKWVLSM